MAGMDDFAPRALRRGRASTRRARGASRGVARVVALGLTVLSARPLFVASNAAAQEAPSAPIAAPEPRASAPSRSATAIEPLDLERVLRGEGRGLTADEVARRAIESAPGLEQSRAQLEQARAGAAQAYLAFFPRLDITARYTRLSPITQGSFVGGGPITPEQQAQLARAIDAVSDPAARSLFRANIDSQIALSQFSIPVFLDTASIGAELRYPVSDVFLQVWPSYEGAERMVDAQEASLEASAAVIGVRAREAFYNYARARAAAAVAESMVQTIEAQEEVVRAAVGAGASARIDLMRLEAQLASARVALERARGGTAIAAEALRALLHEDLGEIAVGEDLLAPIPEVTETREALIQRAYSDRPESRAIAHLLRARDRQVEAAEGSRYPHLVLDAQFSYDNPNQRLFPPEQRFVENYAFSVILAWSPNDLFMGEERARGARAARAEHEAQLAQLHDGIRIEVTQAYEARRAARLALDAAQTGVGAAEEGVRVRTEQYRVGAGVITELMAATADLARAQLELVSSAIDARIAEAQLARATGADSPRGSAAR